MTLRRWTVGRYSVKFAVQPWSLGLSLAWDHDEAGPVLSGLVGPIHYLVCRVGED